MSGHKPVSPFVAGLHCRCPRCGDGALFDGFLTVRPVCSACGFDLAAADSGDGPAVFVMFIVGPVVTGLALWVETAFAPPYWLHLALWIPAALGGSLALLRPFKATLIALQYRHRASDSGTNDFGDQE